ncbi:SAM-dependent methyltransferase [Alkalilacustris brevis]|uniref:SAM-dependent methyltransferase n=1 Tax=Alkalilacustris brevis TaxID=2026338 RepID=UPI000E0D5C88|nr:TrmO family methyltransferase [Alkalilacustris brevis]
MPRPSETRFAPRTGESRLDFDPAARPDAGVVFIGRIRSPWGIDDCPKNLRAARETGQGARFEIDAAYRAGLEGIAPGDRLVALYWMAEAPRDLIRQKPRHRDRATGVFALRSPARPNPVALGVVRCVSIDAARGVIEVDAIDAFDGTPLIDIKPFVEAVDTPDSAG